MVSVGSVAVEKATGLKGMVTHLRIESDGSQYLSFQPRGLNPETGQPVKAMWVVPARLEGGERLPTDSFPVNILGTEVEDDASGFKGTAVALIVHISGCVHIEIQPAGQLAKSGDRISTNDFDVRRLRGPAITPMTDEERAASQAQTPSPAEVERYEPGGA